MAVIGIDPGLSGALAFLNEDGSFVLHDTPTLRTGKGSRRVYDLIWMRADLAAARPCYVILEQVSTRPGQSAQSGLATGRGAGLWEGLLCGLDIPYEIVRPQRWRKDLGIAPKSGKAGGVEYVSRRWPDAPIRGPRGGLLDGRVDALCLAAWGQRNFNGGSK